MMEARKHQKRPQTPYLAIVWLAGRGDAGIPDIWVVQASYKAQVTAKIKKYYTDQDWPQWRAIHVKRLLESDFQRIL